MMDSPIDAALLAAIRARDSASGFMLPADASQCVCDRRDLRIELDRALRENARLRQQLLERKP